MDTEALLDRYRLKRRLAIWRTVAIVAVVGFAVTMVARFVDAPGEHIARLSVDGIIVEDPRREAALSHLVEDDEALALIVRINSPGGTTTGSEALFRNLRRVAEEKPVVAVIGTMGASGGYIAAVAADYVIARETSLTGSIGVILETAEFSRLLEKIGITAEAITSGPQKGQPSPTAPMTEETRAAVSAVVGDAFDWFKGLVSERRKLSEEEILVVSDGRVFTGRQALGHKLIDRIGGEREAIGWLERDREIPEDLPIVELEYHELPPLIERVATRLAGKVLSFEPLMLDGLRSVWHPR